MACWINLSAAVQLYAASTLTEQAVCQITGICHVATELTEVRVVPAGSLIDCLLPERSIQYTRRETLITPIWKISYTKPKLTGFNLCTLSWIY